MKHTIIFLFVLIICMVSSCKDKDKTVAKSYCEENPGKCKSVLEAKKYFAFKIGSWWVFKEETSGEKDSVYVTNYYNPDNYDFDIRLHSTLKGYNYHYWPLYASGSHSCSTVNPIAGTCLFIKKSKTKPGDYQGEGYCFFVNYTLNSYLGSANIYFENNQIIVSDVKDSFSLGNLTFATTIKIHELNSLMEGRQATNHYYSRNVGLIRKELLDSNQIWNLVDYHIEP